jgi:aspartate kinase
MSAIPKPSLVQKYGGSSLATPEQIQSIAKQIVELSKAYRVVVVVSAMGKTTDQLIELAYQVSREPNRRELDMLLTTGERVSMALMSMAINSEGASAISFTGSQSGVMTDDCHSSARIIAVRPYRVEAELARGQVVVLAGFQGVSPTTKEITTLGRGGSDTTAVAIAGHFQAVCCEIRKDVDGIYSADPRIVADAHHISQATFAQVLEMTYWGAKVLHYRSVELAAIKQVSLIIALADEASQTSRRTTISSERKASMPEITPEIAPGLTPNLTDHYEVSRVLSVNSHRDVRTARITAYTIVDAIQIFNTVVESASLPLPVLLDMRSAPRLINILFTAPDELLNATAAALAKDNRCQIDPTESRASVTATCQGAYGSDLTQKLAAQLSQKGIMTESVLLSAMSITFIVAQQHREPAIRALHEYTTTSSSR